MNTYTTEASVTLPDGKEVFFLGTVDAESYREALGAAAASFPEELEWRGILGRGGATIRVWGPDARKFGSE